MKLINHIQSENFSNVFLYVAFMFANIDYVGIVDYVIKALLGALIWYAVKLAHDRYSLRMHKKIAEENKSTEENKEQEKK